jgi:4-alpha-glucanotransferase
VPGTGTQMNPSRHSGILLHISSLPSRWGIGDIGYYAEKFADFLHNAGFQAWQILPLSPVSDVCNYSPYSCDSAFAGATMFISPEKLFEYGLISNKDIQTQTHQTDISNKANYEYAIKVKNAFLKTAWQNFSANSSNFFKLNDEFKMYQEKEKYWLDDYALFKTLKEHFAGARWNAWPEEYRRHDAEALNNFASDAKNQENISFISFGQFIFDQQLQGFHNYCQSREISLIGDMPMFMSLDSADVWAHQNYYDLDDSGCPSHVAGVPPDYFSSTGQKWGNPLYRWDQLEADDYEWWKRRIKKALAYYDTLRIDHFRGFCGCWTIPASADNAVTGYWQTVPGNKLFDELMPEVTGRELPFIAEDLGVITDDVRKLMAEKNIPGMNVFLFAFGGNVGNNPYAPHNIRHGSVAYTGTHDNNTVRGWWNYEASESEIDNLISYTGQKVTSENVSDILTRIALFSAAKLAIIPMQDILALDSECRMNTPGTTKNNWKWRLNGEQFNELLSKENGSLCSKYRKLNVMYGRAI